MPAAGPPVKMHANQSYLVSGLSVQSELELPELIGASAATRIGRAAAAAEPDVEIRIGAVPEHLPGSDAPMPEVEIAGAGVLLKIPNVARYHVSAGRRILVAPEAGAAAADVRLFLLGSAFGAIYFQRGLLPLHASVVVIGRQGVAFAGESGAGKSTLAAWMNAQGYPLLCDDVCVVHFDAQGQPMAYPGIPRLKLWKDALAAFDLDRETLQPDHSRLDKYHVPVSALAMAEPVPLRHIHVLQFSAAPSAPVIEPVPPAQAVHLLRNHTYRYQYISSLGLTRSHFEHCVRLARGAQVHTLTRARHHSVLAECQQLIERQTR